MPQDPATDSHVPLRAHVSLVTNEPSAFGSGWISGLLSALFGVVGLGAVLCFHFPDLLTMPQLRSYYPVASIRALVHIILVASFLLGLVSVCLRGNKTLGLMGMTLALIAALLGGSRVPLMNELTDGPFLGLDWFVLNLFVYSAIYIPLERFFAKRIHQPTFRPQWRVDLTYFFVNSLLIEVLTLLTLKPAAVLFDWARVREIHEFVSHLPLVIQIPVVVLAADLMQYWVHRTFHSIPVLWKFHAIHHSSEVMDWLAGSRLHLVDLVITRGLTYVPIYILGFSDIAIGAYAVIVVIQATFIHANVRWEFSAIRSFVATPCFHHWHHAAEREAVDKNFAVHFPVWDRLFGTYYMPGRWPNEYGLCGHNDVPRSWTLQLLYPFWRRNRPSTTQPSDPK